MKDQVRERLGLSPCGGVIHLRRGPRRACNSDGARRESCCGQRRFRFRLDSEASLLSQPLRSLRPSLQSRAQAKAKIGRKAQHRSPAGPKVWQRVGPTPGLAVRRAVPGVESDMTRCSDSLAHSGLGPKGVRHVLASIAWHKFHKTRHWTRISLGPNVVFARMLRRRASPPERHLCLHLEHWRAALA